MLKFFLQFYGTIRSKFTYFEKLSWLALKGEITSQSALHRSNVKIFIPIIILNDRNRLKDTILLMRGNRHTIIIIILYLYLLKQKSSPIQK